MREVMPYGTTTSSGQVAAEINRNEIRERDGIRPLAYTKIVISSNGVP